MTKKKKIMNDLLGTGIGGMAGLGAIGAMNSIPGMPANNVGNTVGAGVNIAAIGGLSNIAMSIIPKNGKSSKKRKYKRR